MSGNEQIEINRFAIDLQNVSAKVTSILEEETREFLSQKHKYKSLKEFHEAHPKGRCQMEAEFLAELGYRKASEVAREIFEEIWRVFDTAIWAQEIEIKSSETLRLADVQKFAVRKLAIKDMKDYLRIVEKKYTEGVENES